MLWKVVLLLLMAWSTQSDPSLPGIIIPNKTVAEEGVALVLNCTTPGIPAANMSFTLYANEETSILPSKIVGPNTIQLAINSMTLNMTGAYQCMNNNELLQFHYIYVGRRPVSPEIQCSSVNKVEDFLCRFVPSLDEVKEYTRMPQPKYKFRYTCTFYGGSWLNCSGTAILNASGIFWPNRTSLNHTLLMNAEPLVIRLNVCNVLGCDFKKREFDRWKIDRPRAPIVEVKATKRSVFLNWTMTTRGHSNYTFRIHCTGDLLNKTFINLNYSREVPHIPPYTHVKCEVRAKSLPPFDGQWSDPVIVATITKEDAPRKSPDVGPGIYSVDSPTDGTKDVHIYYEALKKEDRNGVFQHYRVTCPSGNIIETKQEAVCSKLHPYGDYVISVAACTRVGCSQPASTIHVLPTSSGNTLQSPELYIICGEDSDSCTFHYKLPSSAPDDAKLYLLSCLRDKRKEKCKEVHIDALKRNESSLVKTVLDFNRMQYALSLVAGDKRSAIERNSWIQCFYKGSIAPLVLIKNQFDSNSPSSCHPIWTCSIRLKFNRFRQCEEGSSPLERIAFKVNSSTDELRPIERNVVIGQWYMDVLLDGLNPLEKYNIYAYYRLESGEASQYELITRVKTGGIGRMLLWTIVLLLLGVLIVFGVFAFKGIKKYWEKLRRTRTTCTDGIRSIIHPHDLPDGAENDACEVRSCGYMELPPIFVDVNSIPNEPVEPTSSTREEPVVAPPANVAVAPQMNSVVAPKVTVLDKYTDHPSRQPGANTTPDTVSSTDDSSGSKSSNSDLRYSSIVEMKDNPTEQAPIELNVRT